MRLLKRFLILHIGIIICFQVFGEDKLKYTLSLKPSLLHSSVDDITAPALKFNASIKRAFGLAPKDDVSLSVETKGAVATDARANPDNIYAIFDYGYSHTFSDWEAVSTTNMTSERPSARPVKHLVYKFGGLLDLFCKTQFETDQAFDNYDVTIGPHVGFTPLHQKGFTYLVPSSYVDYQRVEVLHSRRNEQIGIPDNAFWRFDVSAGWYYPVGTVFLDHIFWLKPLDLQYDLHYYRAFDLPSGATSNGLDDGFYQAGTIGYNLRILSGTSIEEQPWWKPSYVYVSASQGRLPPNVVDQTSVYAGVVFTFGN